MNISPTLAIACQDVASSIPKEGSLESRLQAAMRLTKNGHWLLMTEDEYFRCAVGAVLLKATPSEQDRIKADMLTLNALSALLGGVPVDMTRIEIPENPLGLMGMWKAIKTEEVSK